MPPPLTPTSFWDTDGLFSNLVGPKDQSAKNVFLPRRRRMTKKKNEKRLGGKALSLESFANAKSRASGYNPSIIKKQREFYRNAKYVSKFKKSIKRECHTEGGLTAAARFKDVDGGDERDRPKVNKKQKEKLVNLQAIREEVEKKRAEAEKAKMERDAMIQEKKEERARAEARRKAQRDKMFKRTRSGQPVMKYRIENILQGMIHDSTK